MAKKSRKRTRNKKVGTRSSSTVQIKNVNVPNTKTRIDGVKYEVIRRAILAVVPRSAKGITFKELPSAVDAWLAKNHKDWTGSVPWYTTTVKLDLEARGMIARIEGERPQRVRRVAADSKA